MATEYVKTKPSITQADLNRYRQFVNVNPAGVKLLQAADPFAIPKIPDEEAGAYTYCWSREDRVQYRKAYFGAELVPAAEYARYGFSADMANKSKNCVNHPADGKKELILMRYKNELWNARLYTPILTAAQAYTSDVDDFEKSESGRRLDETGRRVVKKEGMSEAKVNALLEAQARQMRAEFSSMLKASTIPSAALSGNTLPAQTATAD